MPTGRMADDYAANAHRQKEVQNEARGGYPPARELSSCASPKHPQASRIIRRFVDG